MSSIVIELQQDALGKKGSITDLLRKSFVVARKLRIADFEEWVTHELNGYEDSKDIPAYRQITGSVKAWNPYHGWQPVFFPNSELQEIFTKRVCGQSIAEIESLLGAGPETQSLQMPFTPEYEQKLRQSIKFNTEITLIVSSTTLVRIIDAVRTIILNWSLKLEADGILGEGLAFSPQERETAKKTSYNINNFFGSVQSPQIQQQTSQSYQFMMGDKVEMKAVFEFVESILRQIDFLNLKQESTQELLADINTIKSQAESPRPKHSIIVEGLGSIRRILESAGGGVAAQLIMQLGKILLTS
jgi:hypothetical protein